MDIVGKDFVETGHYSPNVSFYMLLGAAASFYTFGTVPKSIEWSQKEAKSIAPIHIQLTYHFLGFVKELKFQMADLKY